MGELRWSSNSINAVRIIWKVEKFVELDQDFQLCFVIAREATPMIKLDPVNEINIITLDTKSIHLHKISSIFVAWGSLF